ncbi:MAG: corrinoid protein [Eubacteriales bacterium]
MIDSKLLEAAKQSIIDGDKILALSLAQKGLDDGVEPEEFIEKGFVPGIMEIGDLFEDGEVFLPEVMMAADAIKEAVEILNKAMEDRGEKRKQKGRIILATVESDLHDIGKCIVASLLVANGFEVIDLGRDVSNENIIEEAVKHNADIIGTSTLLTTTMIQQQKLESLLKERGLKGRFKTMVGGAPVTSRWCQKIGADGFSENAAEAVTLANELMNN